jgi:hypothetical protein
MLLVKIDLRQGKTSKLRLLSNHAKHDIQPL